jgi:hypothetical protein
MSEKRAHTRYITKIKAELECSDETGKTPGDAPGLMLYGHIINISLGGVYMTAPSPAKADTPVSLCFYIQGRGKKSEKIMFLTRGVVLRSGAVADEPEELRLKYNVEPGQEPYYLAVRFVEPLFKLSSILSDMA